MRGPREHGQLAEPESDFLQGETPLAAQSDVGREAARESCEARNSEAGGERPRLTATARRLLLTVTILTFLAGGAMRVWSAHGDLWLDEVWSLSLAGETASPWDVFTRHHLDNNHYLITLWMYACGGQSPWIVYRLPSLIAGMGTILLAGWIAGRWGTLEAQAAMVLASASFVLIVYASEARGYALAGFFALAAFLALDHFLKSRRAWAAAAFSLAVALGFLSHLTFAHFYLGALTWSVVGLVRRGPTPWAAVRAVAYCQLPPVVFLAGLYRTDVQHMVIGGGPAYSLEAVIFETLALAVGGVSGDVLFGLGALTASLVAVGAAGFALVSLWQARSDLSIFFFVAIFASPLLLLFAPPRVSARSLFLHQYRAVSRSVRLPAGADRALPERRPGRVRRRTFGVPHRKRRQHV